MSKNRIEQDEAFMREVRVGLMVLAVLVSVFLYVAFGKLSGWHEPRPLAFEAQDQDINVNSSAGSLASGKAEAADAHNVPNVKSLAAKQSHAISLPAEPVGVSPVVEPPRRQHARIEVSMSGGFEKSKPGGFSRTNPRLAGGGSKNSLRTTSGGKLSSGDTAVVRTDFAPQAKQSAAIDVESSRFRAGTAPTDAGSGFKPYAATAPPIPAIAPPIPRIVKPEPQDNLPRAGTNQVRQVSATEPIPVSPELLKDELEIDQSSGLSALQAESDRQEEASTGGSVHGHGNSVVAIKDDSFWMIAQRVYGDGRYFDALYQTNKDQVESFNEIPEGAVILTPSMSELRERFPRQCPREKFVTRGGETLFQIAGEKLGQASRYAELLKLNYQRLPDDIQHDTPLPAEISLELPRK